MTVGSQDEAARNCFEAKTNQRSDSPLRSGGEAGEMGELAAKLYSISSKYNSLTPNDYRVEIDVDNLPVRSGNIAEYPPQLSIVVPVYNVQSYLYECLKTLQSQLFTDWEAILVDDGSADLSGLICDDFAKRDTRFHVIHQENRGVSAARNAGIAVACASWITFLDPDDLLPEDYYSSMLQFADKTDSDYVASDFLFFGSKKFERINRAVLALHEGVPLICNTEQSIRDNFQKLLPGGCWGFICKRDTWGNLIFPEKVSIGEDLVTLIQLLPRVKTASFYAEVKYFYRKRPDSLMQQPMLLERYVHFIKAGEKAVDSIRFENDFFTRVAYETLITHGLIRLQDAVQTIQKEQKTSKLYALNIIANRLEISGDIFSLYKRICGGIKNEQERTNNALDSD